MKITRLEIKDYRGIAELAADVGPAGIVVSGKNAKGKTTVLNAITAALAARGIDPADIRHGAESAEILVTMDHLKDRLRVRRRISEAGPSLAVSNQNGDRWAKPQTRLDELLGTGGVDALGFYLAKPADRRKMVLDAMDLTVTAEQLIGWTGDEALVGQLGHKGAALEVVDRYRRHFYDRRTDANRDAKEKKRRWDEALSLAPTVAPPEDTGAVAELRAAEAAIQAIRARDDAAEKIRQGNEGARARIAELRASAEMLDKAVDPERDYDGEVSNLQREVDTIEAQLIKLRAALEQAKENARQVREAVAAASSRRGQADDLERTLTASEAGASVTDDERLQAEGRVTAARTRAEKATRAADERAALAAAMAAEIESVDATKEAERLDQIVSTLTTAAPAHLSKQGGIEGLALDGDRITLDGTDLTSLSGAEQMRFAVRLAKRLNGKAKILIVDGLERLDAVRGVDFVKEATADGWQLFATRVADGELVIEALEL